jgi:hypothetical protein
MHRPGRSLLFVVLLLCLAGVASAQTTGSIVGRVLDTSGSALPGVTVEATSPALQGTRTVVTESDGSFRFSLLPPGLYTVGASLEGFAPVRQSNVWVELDHNAQLDLTMRTALAEAITVTARAAVVDTTSSELGTNLGQRAIETLPTGRNYSSIAQVAPGVASDANPGNPNQNTISVYGSSGAENAYYIDGVNTTNAEYGFQGKELNFEFIQEIDIKTGGYEAEYGRATGGIINVITKSGGNDFSGDVFGYYDADSLQANTKPVVSTNGTVKSFTRKDYGADLGGAILRDKLWFFAAYDRVPGSVDRTLPNDDTVVVRSPSLSNLASAKLTYNLAAAQSLVFTFLQDPQVGTGAIDDSNHSINGEPSTYLGRQDFGGRDYALRYDGSVSSQWILSANAARHQEQNSVSPATSAGEGIQYRDAANENFQTGGFGLIQEKSFDRKFYGGSATRFFTTKSGTHELKGGIELERQTAEVTKRMSGGQQVDVIPNEHDASKPIYSHFYWTTPDATLANAPTSQLVVSPQHHNVTAYLQDRWSIDNVSVSAGVRWDRQQIIDASGVTQIDMKKDYAPRLGVVWDPSGAHQSKLFASYGRFYEQIPMDLVIRSFSYERQPRIVNFSPTSIVPDPAAEAEYKTESRILGGFTEPADPNIKNQYLSEFILGGERTVTNDISVGVRGIYRSYGRVIEDFLCDKEGTYCIGNPGEGIMKQVFSLAGDQYTAPKAKRVYKALQLDANKRFSNNWQAMASYIYSKLDGNYDGEYAPFTNVGADPNISAAYDYYDFFTDGEHLGRITNTGPLSNDRRHQFKASGVYYTPFKLSVGVAAYWRSGTPRTRYGFSDVYGRYEFFLTKRGAEGRMPTNYDADVHFGYPIDVGRAKLNVLLDIFNVLNTQRAILLDQRWGFFESQNASPTPVNPNYGKPVLRTGATSARLGLRLSF